MTYKISERIPHDGKGMPVHPATLVYVELRDGASERFLEGEPPAKASFWASGRRNSWTWIDKDTDITAYYIVTED